MFTKSPTTSVAATLVYLSLTSGATAAQEPCPSGTLFEPYQRICAAINDVRDRFVPPGEALGFAPRKDSGATQTAPGQISMSDDEPPVPGTMTAGIKFNSESYQVTTSSHLHTMMMVYPNGLGVPALPSWIYTTSTNRTHLTIELVGMYRSWGEPTAVLGLFAWPCFESYPCPDGDTSSGWQFFHNYDDLGCNITQIVDQGGHAQKVLHYANHTDRQDDGDPPAWKNAVYLWNYCDAEWDLIWQHEYRQAKEDCSLNNGCAWWGPVFELFGTERYPEIPELGYEQSLLIYDGIWSELRPNEGAGFIDPTARPDLVPWQVFHLDSNRGFGAGSWFDMNDPPAIDAQQPLQVLEDEILTLSTENLVITDSDIDPAYHVEFYLALFGGDNYSHDGLSVTPAPNYFGTLTVPITVSDGAAESQTFGLQIRVIPVNDPPIITGQRPLETLERTPLSIEIQNVNIVDPDNELAELTIDVKDGIGYQRTNNVITPELGVVGNLPVTIVAGDGELESGLFQLMVLITPDIAPPVLTLVGPASVTLLVGSNYQDAGATAVDALDGDITDRIITDNPVNTSRAARYTVSYTVSDLAGNRASTTRTVIVNPLPPPPRSGGGSTDPVFIALLLLGFLMRSIRTRHDQQQYPL